MDSGAFGSAQWGGTGIVHGESLGSRRGARSGGDGEVNQLRGLSADGGLPDVLLPSPANAADAVREEAAAERAVAEVCMSRDRDRKQQWAD
jgi:hypothetical protein